MNLFIVDAFTDEPFRGNPAAVCLLDSAKSDVWMQNVAAEMNLSETAFLIRRDNDYSLRWFTPSAEVDLCGHATLASAHVLWEEGLSLDSELSFMTKSGLLTATKGEDGINLLFPLEIEQECEVPEKLVEALGIPCTYVGRNRFDYLVEVDNEELVRRLKPNYHLLQSIETRGILVTSKSDRPGIDFVSRCFFPAIGVNEDPVTGSAHCCLGPYWQAKLNKSEMVAQQLSTRQGTLKLKIVEDRIIMTGQAVTTLKGRLIGERG
ncbi:PhzF family phenazine biosynthesis protein [Cohnella mopanensis]|uniref:PhzF family phenazine biosynthesis protein n=1 Tax=Cohnella mopanensis TaxID=2911966 RepID=UPI001EF90AFC|nr:PhzF family phenazine biosynthesis protein [Cohnella mopanensis]